MMQKLVKLNRKEILSREKLLEKKIQKVEKRKAKEQTYKKNIKESKQI